MTFALQPPGDWSPLLVLMTCMIGWMTTLPVLALDRNWTGAVSANWSEAGNWNPAGAPQDNDRLLFRAGGDHRSMVNDLPSLTVNLLSFGFEGNNADYQLSGFPLTLAPGAVILTYPDGSSVVTINCPLVFTDSSQVFAQALSVGIISENTADLNLNGTLSIEQGTLGLFTYNSDIGGGQNGHIRVLGPIVGSGNVQAGIGGSGDDSYIEFGGTADNTFAGVMTLSTVGNSRISFNKSSGHAVNGVLEVSGGHKVNLQLTRPDQMGPNSTMMIVTGGQLLLSGNNVGVGSLVLTNVSADAQPSTIDTGGILLGVNNGITAHVDNDHVHPTIKGRLNIIGFEPFNVSGGPEPGLEILATIGGNGFQKTGNGNLRLNANNTFFGDVEITSGAVEALTPTALGQAAGPPYGVHLDGGNLVLQGIAVGNEPLFVTSQASALTAINQCSWAGPVSLNTDLNVVPVDATFSGKKFIISGSISGSGGLNLLPAIFGVGSVQLSGSFGNLFTGTTTVNCQLLELNKPSGVNAYAGPLIVGGAAGNALHEVRWLNSYQNVGATATLYGNGIINLNNHNEDFGPVTFNGGEVDTGTGQFAIYAPLTVNAAPTSAVINGYLGLPPGDNRVFIVRDGAADCDLLVNAVIFGSPGTYFVKQGAGTMCMENFNTYDAPTLLEEGTIEINNSSGLGTWPGLVIFDGATLRLDGSGTGNGFEGIGAGVGGVHGAIEVLANASWTIANGVLLDGPTVFNVGDSGGLGFNAPISSSGPNCSVIKDGLGTLVFGGTANNNYSGDTIINGGGFYLNKSANVISVPGNLIIGPGPAGPTTFARLLQIGGLGGTTVTVNANSLFDLNGNNTSLLVLNLRDGGNVQTTGGILTLPGGTVNVGSLSPFGSHATSTIAGFLAMPFSGTVTFNVSPRAPTPPLFRGPELEVTATISGGINHSITGTLVKQGLGELRLSGNNTFPGNVNVNEGVLIAASANALGSGFRGTAVNNGASLALDAGISVTSEYLLLDSTNGAALDSLDFVNGWGGTIYLNRNSTINVDNSLIATGVIDGPGSLIKVGTGSLTLSGGGNNTYAGETFVNQGTLLLNKPTAVTAIPGAAEVGAIDDSSAGTVRNLSSYQIVGNIYVHSLGLYDVNGQEENTDALVMYGNGTVQTGAGYLSLKTGAPLFVYPGTNTTSTINGNIVLDPGNHVVTVANGSTAPDVNDLVINASISENSTASIQKEGLGRMRLTGANTYTGSTTVNGGTLQVDGSQPQSPIQLSGGTLQGNGIVGTVNFTSSSGVVAPGASPGVLTCSNFNVGALGGGTLQIELDGNTNPTGYDQLNVRGTVKLSNINLSAMLNFPTAVGNQFVIISNDGSDAVLGTFNGLAQDAELTIGNSVFRISYVGGSGNEVVLTKIADVFQPSLTIERVSATSVRLLWPTNDPSFHLQSNTNLSTTNWTTASPQPVVVGSNNVVTNTINDAQRFYRLSKP